MADRTVRLNLSQTGRGDDSVVVDGESIGHVVQRLLLTSQAGKPPTLVVELAARAFEVDAEGTRVGVSPVGQLVLHQLGWLSPTEAEQLTSGRRLAEEMHDAASAAHLQTLGELEQAHAARDGLAELVAEILTNFWEKGHPGKPCQRTGWVPETTLARWRQRLADLSAVAGPPDPPGE